MIHEASCMGPNKKNLGLRCRWCIHFPNQAWVCLGEQELISKCDRHGAKTSTLKPRPVVCHAVDCARRTPGGQAKDAANLELASTAIKQAGWDVWDAELYSQGGFTRLCWM